MEQSISYIKGFATYALAAFLIGIVGGCSAVLGPAFVQDVGTAYNNTTWPQRYGVPANAVAKGFSVYMLVSSAFVIFRPTLGDMVIAASGWRAMIWSCVTICVGVYFASLVTGNMEKRSRKLLANVDAPGAVAGIVHFFCLSYSDKITERRQF